MCQFASFFWSVHKESIRFWDLISHSNTEEHLGLHDDDGWREGHYLPNGSVECRQLPEDMPNIGRAAAEVLKEKHPELESFLETALGKVAPMSEALALAYMGRLDPDSPDWELSDEYGGTVARFVANRWRLPSGFSRWDLSTPCGATVAHYAAYRGVLPETFDQWPLADQHGWTVAHSAARAGKLPASFDQWDLADEKGETVRMAAQRYEQQLADRNASLQQEGQE